MTSRARVLVLVVLGVLVVVLAAVLVLMREPEARGTVTRVVNQQASIDGAPAGGGDSIPAGSMLATDDSGVALFVVVGNQATCELRPASAVVVLPADDLVLRLMRGEAVCDRSGTESFATFAAPGALIEVGDSTVVLGATEDESTTVGNVRGDGVALTNEDGESVVQSGQMAAVSDGAPGPPSPYRADPSVAEAILRVKPDGTTTTGPTSTTSGSTSTTSPSTDTTQSPTTSIP